MQVEPSQLSTDPRKNEEAMAGFRETIRRHLHDDPKRDEKEVLILSELDSFRSLRGYENSPNVKAAAVGDPPMMSGVTWWRTFYQSLTHLAPIAIRLLSVCPSASACETNWSEWSLIHNKRRNRLNSQRGDKLVYVYHNRRLKYRLDDFNYDFPESKVKSVDMSYLDEISDAEDDDAPAAAADADD
jgi:hypothetical protein